MEIHYEIQNGGTSKMPINSPVHVKIVKGNEDVIAIAYNCFGEEFYSMGLREGTKKEIAEHIKNIFSICGKDEVVFD